MLLVIFTNMSAAYSYPSSRPVPRGSDFWDNIELIPNKLTDCLPAWERELENDADKEFLLDGVGKGFDILESKQPDTTAHCKNYNSARVTFAGKTEKQVLLEVSKGNYVETNIHPTIVSSLGAIPKPQSKKIRIIHDMSASGLNQWVSDRSVTYCTVDDATRYMKPGSYLAKIDLASAYRGIPICPRCYRYTGLSWHFQGDNSPKYFFDTKLSFGAAKACQIFDRISRSLCRMMKT